MSDALKVLAKLRKDMGEGIGQQGVELKAIERIPTGIFPIDLALSGGVPRGRVTIIVGNESSGKTALTYLLMAQVQREGKKAIYIDLEASMDATWASKFGLNMKDLIIITPSYAEQAVDVVEALLYSDDVGIIVIDSIAAMTTDNEVASSSEKAAVGGASMIIGKMIRKAVVALSKEAHNNHYPALVCINQIRCLPLDSLVSTPYGLKSIEDLNIGDPILSNSGTCTIKAMVSSGLVEGKGLTLNRRGSFKLSNNHIQPILRKGLAVEVVGSDIVYGDWLLHPIPKVDWSNSCSNYSVSAYTKSYNLDVDLAFFLGVYHSDGYCHDSYDGKGFWVSFTEVNKERHSLILENTTKLFGKDNVTITGYKSEQIMVRGKDPVCLVRSLVGKKAITKDIPKVLLSSSRDVVISFLRGAFFDTHGFNSEGFIFTNVNPSGTKTFSTILARLGVFSNLVDSCGCGYDRLHITGLDAVTFRDTVGFAESTKDIAAKKFNYKTTHGARGKYDVIPAALASSIYSYLSSMDIKGRNSLPYISNLRAVNHNDLNASRVGMISLLTAIKNKSEYLISCLNLFESNYFSEILEVTDMSFEAKDIEVEGGLFIADGVLTHNSKIGVLYGSSDTMPGGNSLRFASSLTIKLYGKDEIVKEVHPAIPTYKVVTGTVQKAKMPILSKTFEYSLSLLPHGNIKVGQSPSWQFVATYCRNAGIMTQAGTGKPWVLLGKTGMTQKDLKQIYETDLDFSQKVHSAIIDCENNKGVVPEVEEVVDPDTGEITQVTETV